MSDIFELRRRASTLFARSGGGLHPPPDVILNWPPPNRINPEERGWEGPIALIIILVITVIVFIARIWARLMVSKNAGMDDLVMGISMLPLIGLSIASILAIRIYGFQWHAWDQTLTTLVTSREITMAIELNYLVSTTLIKISILCFYRRITGSLTTAFVRCVRWSIISCIIYGILFSLLILFTCTPVVGFFRLFDIVWRSKNAVQCRNEGAIIVACAIISTIQDLVICLLPVFLVWNLKMPRRQKIGLCGIFGIGILTCVCGIMRTYYATYVYYYTYDITWYAYYGWIWTAIEADLGVICASAPALKVFFNQYFRVGSRTDYYGSGSHKTPIRLSRSNNSVPYRAGHSAGASRVEPESIQDDGIPFQGIKVSQGLDIRVEDRDDVSQRSFGSTRNLTALPACNQSGWKSPNEWEQPRHSAPTPDSDDELKAVHHGKDIERGG